MKDTIKDTGKDTMKDTVKAAIKEPLKATMQEAMKQPMIAKVINYLQCPLTGSELNLKGNYLENRRGDRYFIDNGIIDFVGDGGKKVEDSSEKKVEDSYREISEEKYNRWVKSKFIMRLVWGVNLDKIPKIKDEASRFSQGIILDIPCGTGIMGIEAYKALADSIFLAIDYSRSMLCAAKRLCEGQGIGNVVFIRADVSSLPIKNNTVSACISLNGFHAFAFPQMAAQELGRCIRNEGKLLMVVSCKGERFISDFMIKHFMIPKGYFHNALPCSKYAEYLQQAGFSKVSYEMMGASMIARCCK